MYTFHNEKQNKDVYMVALRDSGKLIGYYEKHEYRDRETMKMYDLWWVPPNEEVIKNIVDCFLCKTNVHVRYQRYLDDCYWPDSGRYALWMIRYWLESTFLPWLQMHLMRTEKSTGIRYGWILNQTNCYWGIDQYITEKTGLVKKK